MKFREYLLKEIESLSKLNLDDTWEPCEPESLDGYHYRAVGFEEAIKTIKDGHGQNSKTKDLIGNDWTVLEFAFEGEAEAEGVSVLDYLEKHKIIPDWAKRQGMNTTTSLDNVIGYAQNRHGYIMVFDLSKVDDTFEAGEYHTQVKTPSTAKLIGVMDSTGKKCFRKKLNTFVKEI